MHGRPELRRPCLTCRRHALQEGERAGQLHWWTCCSFMDCWVCNELLLRYLRGAGSAQGRRAVGGSAAPASVTAPWWQRRAERGPDAGGRARHWLRLADRDRTQVPARAPRRRLPVCLQARACTLRMSLCLACEVPCQLARFRFWGSLHASAQGQCAHDRGMCARNGFRLLPGTHSPSPAHSCTDNDMEDWRGGADGAGRSGFSLEALALIESTLTPQLP